MTDSITFDVDGIAEIYDLAKEIVDVCADSTVEKTQFQTFEEIREKASAIVHLIAVEVADQELQ